ncbi:SAM-dependent methyltransferase [Micromonospora gifhornensis]|uniref:SAM-dependent methyltransferase n=1 Tax=Micromonospora TaxID=1873 RepID=UPI000C887048|nr:SAM-dependent methyltransferase [Verrucosispora sp. ts21]PMR62212.1 SAM-dependent methyltransferase [Verrucosispora sp. ts21]
MAETTDWHDWHSPYADDTSALSRRLRIVQRHIDDWLDQRPEFTLRVVSVCAGQGHDLIGVLTRRSDADRVQAELIEKDPRNATAARKRAAAAGLGGITVRCTDAGDFAAYRTAVPADLVLLAGVLGNISDQNARATITSLPRLCAPGATVIWTRTRRPPDLTPVVRRWFAGVDFTEQAFDAPPDELFSVGVHLFRGRPDSPPPSGRIFTFAR